MSTNMSLKKRIIPEDDFAAQMQKRAEPLLESVKKSFYLERQPGEKIYCEAFFPKNPRAVILISHGFTEGIPKYHELIYYYLLQDYAVYIPEHCGHGRSYRLTKDPSKVHLDRYERYRDDFLCVARAAYHTYPYLPIYVFGHSMGGGIALAAAAEDPSLFSKLILNAPMIRPLTGAVPWPAAKAICAANCQTGHEQDYVIGQGPYKDDERFEDSAAISKPRFEYYHHIRSTHDYLQLGGASYAWLRESVRLSDDLLNEGWKQIGCPVLLFQAEQDDFVDNQAQDSFLHKLHSRSEVTRIRVPDSKHEIFNSHDNTVALYLKKIFAFIS